MDINLFKQLLEVLASVGVEEVVIEPTDDGTLIRGANKDLNVVVYHTIEASLVEHPLGIQTVKGLLSRIQLFDIAKASINLESSDELVVDFSIKQGRKKASFKCADPRSMAVPKKIPGDLSIENRIEFDRSYVEHLSQAISAMSYTGSKAERSISMGVKDSVAEFSIFDGEDDTFSDEIDLDFPDTSKTSWDVAPFQRVLKQSLDMDGENAVFTITEFGIAVFDVGIINVLVAPVSR